MMICPGCGKTIDEQSKTCCHCGANCPPPPKAKAQAEHQAVAPQWLVDHPALDQAPATQPQSAAQPEPAAQSEPARDQAPADPSAVREGQEPARPRRKAPQVLLIALAGLLILVLALTLLDTGRPGALPGPDTRLLQPAPGDLARLAGTWRLVVTVTEPESNQQLTMTHEGTLSLDDLSGVLNLDLALISLDLELGDGGFDLNGFAKHDPGYGMILPGYYHQGVISFSYPGLAVFDAAEDSGLFRDSRALRQTGRRLALECELTQLAPLARLSAEGGE